MRGSGGFRNKPLFDGGGAVDLGIVLLIRRQADLRGDAELVGHVDAVEPAVEGFLGAGDADLDLARW